MVAPSCALMSSPMIGRRLSRKRRSHWDRGDGTRHAIDHRDAGFQRAFHVEARRLLRADGKEIDQDLGAGFPERRDDLLLGGLGRVGADEAARAGPLHVRGHAVEDAAHAHGDAGRGDIFLKNCRAIRGGEDGFAEILADLAGVGIDREHERDVGQPVAADPLVHQSLVNLRPS